MPNSLWLNNRKDVGYADSCLMSVVSLLNVPQKQCSGSRNIGFFCKLCKCGANGSDIDVS